MPSGCLAAFVEHCEAIAAAIGVERRCGLPVQGVSRWAIIDQYARTGIPFPALRSIFITHHHADHNIEYGPLLVVG